MKNHRAMFGLVVLLSLLPSAPPGAFWSKVVSIYRIHQAITSEALGQLNYSGYPFNSAAINIVNEAHSFADSDPYLALDHFDSETLFDSFILLRTRRGQLMGELAKPSPSSLQVWQLLGYMLHQVQDFYSHSNWVESGHTAIVDFGALTETPPGAPYPPFLLQSDVPESTCASPGIALLSAATGTAAAPVSLITTGYYTDALIQNPPPPGKCAHGSLYYAATAGCVGGVIGAFVPDGISRDHPCFNNAVDESIYKQAKDLATSETVQFVQAIIHDLEFAQNTVGLCVLFGIDLSTPVCGNPSASGSAGAPQLQSLSARCSSVPSAADSQVPVPMFTIAGTASVPRSSQFFLADAGGGDVYFGTVPSTSTAVPGHYTFTFNCSNWPGEVNSMGSACRAPFLSTPQSTAWESITVLTSLTPYVKGATYTLRFVAEVVQVDINPEQVQDDIVDVPVTCP